MFDIGGCGDHVTVAEENAGDSIRGVTANSCSVEMAAFSGIGRKGREKEVEVGLEYAVWLVLDGVLQQ